MEFMSTLRDAVDAHKPSVFELLSEAQLSALLPPSIRYVLVIATQRYPRYLLRILNSFDELYALVMLLVERHFLLTYGGGFTEHFYGLKRERVLRVQGGETPRTQQAAPSLVREALKLRTSDVWKNLAIMVGVPYLKRKLDEGYERYGPQPVLVGPRYTRNELPPDATLRQRFGFYYKWFLRHVYPSVNAAYYFSLLAFNMGYLFSNTTYSSPFLWLIQTRMRRLGAADYRAIAEAEAGPVGLAQAARPGQGNSIFNPRTFVTIVIPKLLSGLKFFLPASIFALKFLEWWHQSDFARQLARKATESLQLPPPVIAGLAPPAADVPAPPKNSVALAGAKPGSAAATAATAAGAATAPPSTTTASEPLSPPISSITHLPILTVPPPTAATSALCPICQGPVINATAAPTGYVFCYTCIFRWVEGTHDRQLAWMEGGSGAEAEESQANPESNNPTGDAPELKTSRIGHWENGRGRCAVTGRRLLGGTDGLRRVMV